jgi:hypothetical protein
MCLFIHAITWIILLIISFYPACLSHMCLFISENRPATRQPVGNHFWTLAHVCWPGRLPRLRSRRGPLDGRPRFQFPPLGFLDSPQRRALSRVVEEAHLVAHHFRFLP